MSLEAWGSDDPVDADDLYRAGWESDPDAKVWWRTGEPETTFTWDEALLIYEESRCWED